MSCGRGRGGARDGGRGGGLRGRRSDACCLKHAAELPPPPACSSRLPPLPLRAGGVSSLPPSTHARSDLTCSAAPTPPPGAAASASAANTRRRSSACPSASMLAATQRGASCPCCRAARRGGSLDLAPKVGAARRLCWCMLLTDERVRVGRRPAEILGLPKSLEVHTHTGLLPAPSCCSCTEEEGGRQLINWPLAGTHRLSGPCAANRANYFLLA